MAVGAEVEGGREHGRDGAGEGAGGEKVERVEAAYWELGRALEVEPAVRAATTRKRARRRDAGQVQLTGRDLAALTWVAEQYAVFQPQLEQLLGCSTRRAYAARSRWMTAGWAAGRTIRTDQPPLVWLTSEGLRMCELDFPTWRPTASPLAHIRAVNDVRLWFSQVRPGWAWTSERELARRQTRTAAGVRLGHRPDAVIAADDGEIPIEVELTVKDKRRTETIMREAVRAYGSVWYFAPDGPGRALGKVAEAAGVAERVKIDALPGAPAEAAPT